MGKSLKGKELGTGIVQRADGRYQARSVINGKRIELYNKNLAVLRKEFEKAKEEVRLGLDSRKQYITLDAWYEEWFEKYKKPFLKESSIYPMMSKYKSTFGKKLGSKKLENIRNIDVQEAVNQILAEGRASSSVKEALSILRQCLESARNNRILLSNPSLEILVPTQEKKVLRRFLTQKEQDTFLLEANTTFYKEMFYVMFLTGLRVGEVGGLKWEDIDFEKECICIKRSLMCQYEKGVKKMRLTTPKTPNSYRTIPFMGEIKEMLLSQKEKQDIIKQNLGERYRSKDEFSDLVFTTSMGSPVTRYVAEKEINKIVEHINEKRMYEAAVNKTEYEEFQRMYPHAIRHTFCSRCFEKGMTPKVVQMLMGHANYATTIEIYTHITSEHFEKEAIKFGNAVSTQL